MDIALQKSIHSVASEEVGKQRQLLEEHEFESARRNGIDWNLAQLFEDQAYG